MSMSKPVKRDRWVLKFRYRYLGVGGKLHWMPTTGIYNQKTHIEKRFSSEEKAIAWLEERKGKLLDFEHEPIFKITDEVCYMSL